jgi:hypothetical protein
MCECVCVCVCVAGGGGALTGICSKRERPVEPVLAHADSVTGEVGLAVPPADDIPEWW